jgi:hypothetical protein
MSHHPPPTCGRFARGARPARRVEVGEFRQGKHHHHHQYYDTGALHEGKGPNRSMASLLNAPRYSPPLFTLCGFISGAIELCFSIAGVPLVQTSVMFTLVGFIPMLLYCGDRPRANFCDRYLAGFIPMLIYCGDVYLGGIRYYASLLRGSPSCKLR